MTTIKKGVAAITLSLISWGASAQNAHDFITPEFKLSRTLELIRAQYAYAAGYTGQGILIAIVDTGLDIHHPEFTGRISPFKENYLPGFAPDDVHSGLDVGSAGHGTHVAGLAAAARDGVGMHGVAYDAMVLPLRTNFDNDQLDRAFDRAIATGAKVLNGSYGPDPIWSLDPSDPNAYRGVLPFQAIASDMEREYHMAKRAADADIVLFYAAGNSREEHPGPYTAMPLGAGMLPLITPSNTRLGPNEYLYRFLEDIPDGEPALFLGDPGSDQEAWEEYQALDFSDLTGALVAVVATDPDGNIASYSNLCGAAKGWCLSAPGGGASGLAWSTVPYGKYNGAAGTSMAAPVAAGAAAVLRQAFPYMSARHIIELMLTSADSSSHAAWADSDTYGRGMLDLGKAINGPVVFGDPMFNTDFSVNTQGFNSTWSNDISGTGGLQKSGSGTLILTGNNSYQGQTMITGGTLVVNGTIDSSSHLLIGSAATLRGTGTVGTSDVYGTVSPGNSVGTLQVNGDYTQHAGSVYELELGEAGVHDKLMVSGKADIQSGSTLSVLGLQVAHLGQAHTFLEAGAWGEHNFSVVGPELAFIDLNSTLTDAGLALRVQRNTRSFASLGANANQRRVATAIESQGLTGKAYTDLVFLSNTDNVPALFDALSGEIYASTTSALFDINDNLARANLQRAYTNQNRPVYARKNQSTAWGQIIGSWGQLNGRERHHDLDRSTQGLMFGADLWHNDKAKAGLSLGYTDSTFKARPGERAKVDGYHALAYADAKTGSWVIRGGLGYSWYRLSTRRDLGYLTWGTADSRHQAQAAQLFGELSYAIGLSELKFAPYVGYSHTHLRQKGFSESGSPVGLKANSQGENLSHATFGVRTELDLNPNRGSTLSVSAGAGWRHALNRVEPSRKLRFSTGESFRVTGASVAKNALVAEFGLQWLSTKRSKVSLHYAGQMAGNTRDHGIQARASWAF